MTKTKWLLAFIILTFVLTALTSFACNAPVSPTAIDLLEDDIKTEYAVGDQLDTTGMKFKISYSDMTNKTYDIEEIRGDLEFTNFDTTRTATSLRVTITYKGQARTTFLINVLSVAGSKASYIVRFETFTDKKIADVRVQTNNTVDPPEDPTREGYYFDGWYTDETFANAWEFNTTTIKSDTTLYAKWGHFLTVYFRPGNGIEDIVRSDVKPNVTYTNVPLIPERVGYVGEWDYAGEWDDLTNNQVISAKYSPRKYAVFFHFQNLSDVTVDVSLNIDFQWGDNVNQIAGDSMQALEKPAPAHKVITGWRIRGYADSTKPTYTELPGMDNITADIHIEAVYETETHKVTFDFGVKVDANTRYFVTEGIEYNSIIPLTQVPDESEKIDTSFFLRNAFKGWYYDAQLTVEWRFETDRVLQSNLVLYAKWVDLVMVRFFSDGAGQNLYHEETVEKGGNLQPPDPPLEVGFSSVWSVGADGFVNIQNDLNVYCLYATRYYRIEFRMPDGKTLTVEGNDDQILQHGAKIEKYPADPEQQYFVFSGWTCANTDANFNSVTMDMIIVASFKRINYSVVFKWEEEDGQEQQTTITAQAGDPISESQIPTNPARGETYLFTGWFQDGIETPWNMSTNIVVEEMVLVAGWTPLHLVIFLAEDNAELSRLRVRHSGYVSQNDVPEIPAKVGNIGEWIDSNNFAVVVTQAVVLEDTTFKARYAFEIYQVMFMFPGATSDEVKDSYTVEAQYGSVIAKPNDPVKKGYDFDGWDGYSENLTATKNITFSARFIAWKIKVMFVVNDSNVVSEELIILEYEVSYGQPASPPANPDNYNETGYRFTGWNPSIDIMIVDNKGDSIKIVALYEKMQYAVRFIFKTSVSETLAGTLNIGHGETIQTQQIETIESEAAAVLVLAGHSFIGWNFDESANEDKTDDIKQEQITKERTVYAMFKLNEHTINLLSGQTTIATIQRKYGEVLSATTLSTALSDYQNENEGFEKNKAFMGWYTDQNTSVVYIPGIVTGDLSLYALWIEMKSGDAEVLYAIDTTRGIARVVGYSGDKADVQTITLASHFSQGAGQQSYPVKEISDMALAGLTSLQEVTLSETLETIGTQAFSGCTALKKITIPASVTKIDANAFKGCTSLEELIFEARGVVALIIGESAFYGAKSLSKIYMKSNQGNVDGLPEGLQEIKANAFNGATSLQSVIIPATVVTIEDKAFYGASSLRYARFNRSTPPRLGYNVFTDVEPGFRIYVAVRSNYDNDTPTSDGWVEFKGKSKIYEFANISYDGLWAFTRSQEGNDEVAVVVQYLGDEIKLKVDSVLVAPEAYLRVASLGDYVFNSKVEELTIPSDIQISERSLGGMPNLTHFIFIIKDNSYINRAYIKAMFDENPKLTQLSLSAKEVLRDVFGGAGLPVYLKVVNILNEDSVNIPARMFENVMSIEVVNLPTNLVEIGEYAFAGCMNLREINFADYTQSAKAKTIGTYAFYNATSFTFSPKSQTAIVPNSVENIGLNALENTAFIKTKFTYDIVTVGAGILYKYVGTSNIVTIDYYIKRINDRAFYGNTSVVTVMSATNYKEQNSIPTLESIGAEAFSGMTQLENVIIASTVLKTIEDRAFAGSPRFSKMALLTTQNAPAISANTFQETHEGLTVYLIFQTVGTEWAAFNIKQLSNPSVSEWFLDKLDNQNKVNVIAYLGSNTAIEMGLTFTHTGTTSPQAVESIGAYVIPQYVTKLTVDVDLALNKSAFDGLPAIEEFTITNLSGDMGIDTSAFKEQNAVEYGNLLVNNPALTQVTIPGAWTLNKLFNGMFPSTIKEVKVIAMGANNYWLICDEMFKDAVYVEKITPDAYLVANNIGRDAFKNSGWLNAQSTEEVAYMANANGGKIAVAYTGNSNTIVLNSEYIAIAPYAFAGNSVVEIIDVGENVTGVGQYAFSNMSSLIKVFLRSASFVRVETGVLTGTESTRIEIFLKESIKLSQDYASSPWASSTNNATSIDNIVEDGDYIYDSNSYTLHQIKKTGSVEVPLQLKGQDLVYSRNILFAGVTDLTINANATYAAATFGNIAGLQRIVIDGVAEDAWTPADSFPAILKALLEKNKDITTIAYNAATKLRVVLGGDTANIVLSEKITTLEILPGVTKTAQYLLETSGKNIANIIMPTTLVSFGIGSFEGSVWYKNQSDFIIVQDGILYKYKGTSTQLTVPANVKIISERAFSRLGYNAQGVAEWSSYTSTIRFAANSQLIEIRDEAFYKANGLTSMDLPGTLRIVSAKAFDECYFSQAQVLANMNGLLIIRGGTSSTLVNYQGSTQSVVIPLDVKYILPGAFQNNTTLESVTFTAGSMLQKIWDSAFSGCTNLQTIDGLPDSLIYVGKDAFKGINWTGATADLISDAGRVLVYYSSTTEKTVAIEEALPYANIRSIAGAAFASIRGGSASAEIIVKINTTELIQIDTEAFYDIKAVYVPDALLDYYQGLWIANAGKVKPISEYLG
ncbi:MAG: leucine-rich repeat protein [Christensenellaceae bacterium]|jgi:uncharacterized repeat protein (TIGR02543 family)|nr:leucine-rich repeat protein [Christensenellaceae bacterium]